MAYHIYLPLAFACQSNSSMDSYLSLGEPVASGPWPGGEVLGSRLGTPPGRLYIANASFSLQGFLPHYSSLPPSCELSAKKLIL